MTIADLIEQLKTMRQSAPVMVKVAVELSPETYTNQIIDAGGVRWEGNCAVIET